VSVVLGTLALWLLSRAATMRQVWEQRSAAEFDLDHPGWIAWLVVFAAAGFVATLAFRPPTVLRYHPLRASLGALVPVLLLIQTLGWYAGWTLPMIIRGPYAWMGVDAQAVLAALVGVSFACGFESGTPASQPTHVAAVAPSPSTADLDDRLTPSGRP
jgi:hypothetical protein